MCTYFMEAPNLMEHVISRTCKARDPDQLAAHDNSVGVIIELLRLDTVKLSLGHILPLQHDLEAEWLKEHIEAEN